MKLLDPFAGYRLASGHPLFHVALFVGSFMVAVFGKDGSSSEEHIEGAFLILRWGHFIQIVLAIIEGFSNSPSDIKKKTGMDAELNL